jgi:hypothetical protein
MRPERRDRSARPDVGVSVACVWHIQTVLPRSIWQIPRLSNEGSREKAADAFLVAPIVCDGRAIRFHSVDEGSPCGA